MINILPEEGRRKVKREYILRMSTVAVWAASCVALILGALLFPSYVLVRGTQTEIAREAARLKSIQENHEDTANEALALAKSELTLFSPIAAAATPSTILARILEKRVSGVSLTLIQYDLSSGKITVSGTAATRDRLLSFFDAVKSIEGMKDANLPVSDLAKNENAPFSISVVYSNEK